MILVLGASGYTGQAVTRALVARGMSVRALVRREDGRTIAQATGAAEVIVGDMRELPALRAAMRGVDGVFFVGPRFIPEEAAVGRATVDLAVAEGVRRFVLSGVYHPTIAPLVNHDAKRLIEDHLYKTDLEFTVLQPARYMHGLLLSSWDRIVHDGVLADAFSADAKMAYVDYLDVAEVAATAFCENALVRGTFELAAPGEFTLRHLAASLSKVLGRAVQAATVPLTEYAPAADLMQHPYSADGFGRLRTYYDQFGFRGGNSLILRTILRREPTDFATAFQNLRRTRKAPAGEQL